MSAGAQPAYQALYHDYSQSDPPHQPLYLDFIVAQLREANATRVLDAGCGDGNFSASLAEAGFQMSGIDQSTGGIAKATLNYPACSFVHGSVYEPFPSIYDAIVSVEVIEHLYSPLTFVKNSNKGLPLGGTLIITTPYWGYLKNVLLSVTNRMDRALNPLWEGGHIKHFSFAKLRELLETCGFEYVAFHGAGRRIPYCWMGMAVVARKIKEW